MMAPNQPSMNVNSMSSPGMTMTNAPQMNMMGTNSMKM